MSLFITIFYPLEYFPLQATDFDLSTDILKLHGSLHHIYIWGYYHWPSAYHDVQTVL